MDNPPTDFLALLETGTRSGGFGADDTLAALLPLFEQVSQAHQQGKVAPLDGPAAIFFAEGALYVLPDRLRSPTKNSAQIDRLQKTGTDALEVVAESGRHLDLDNGRVKGANFNVADAGDPITRPVYVPGYVTWEHRIGHHDPLTDVLSLGLMLASCACGLNFTKRDSLENFAAHRGNLFVLNPHLHPVIASVILQMTELNRHRRIQTLEEAIHRLRTYRDQSADFAVDFSKLKGFRESAVTERGKIILGHLRNRLFEISRRNRLIYFKPTLQTLNLTLASFPLLLDQRNIKASQLFIWQEAIARPLIKGDPILLGQYVRFEDAPYAAGVLDQIIANERRDRQEYGFSQLRLVICFLRWHNLKETPEERIHSPLLLLPVEVSRKKGVRDAYVLRALSGEAQVNPALRHHLQQLYGLNLPESVDLAETTVDEFHALIAAQIRASEPGVTLIKLDRPQIEIIHERARQRLEQFRRRQPNAAPVRHATASYDYSYDPLRFRPLGLQLFQNRVQVDRPQFGSLAGKPPSVRQPQMTASGPGPDAPAQADQEAKLYTVRQQSGAGNPYQWEFDLCSQTLGNFNYRKMSLVRDYSALLEQAEANAAVETIFSAQPKPVSAEAAEVAFGDQYPVVESDPTQARAVVRSRDGQSYIIQGPPGTGKSQTITNLIADFVARGKRVLFVCEKRAAIDVVFHRLGRQGLDELCCLIYDSQADKRDFIRNIKETYEDFLQRPIEEVIDARRNELSHRMERELGALRQWSETLEGRVAGCGITVRTLLSRLIELRPDSAPLDPLAFEQIPPYATWMPSAEIVRALSAGLKRAAGGQASLAEHSFRHLSTQALLGPQPLSAITAASRESGQLLEQIGSAFSWAELQLPIGTVGDLEALIEFAQFAQGAAKADALELLNPRNLRSKRVLQAVQNWRAAEEALRQAQAGTPHWRDKFNPEDTTSALTFAREVQKSPLRWMQPRYWHLRSGMLARYDFSQHVIAPPWSQILANLQGEHVAAANLAQARTGLAAELGEFELSQGVALVESLPSVLARLHPAARALHAYLVENPEAIFTVEQLVALQPKVARLKQCLDVVVCDFAGISLSELKEELKRLQADLAWLPELLPVLVEVALVPPELLQVLRQIPLSAGQLEAAMARRSLLGIYQQDPGFEATNGRIIAQRIGRLREIHREWLDVNAAWIHQRIRRTFLQNVQLSTRSVAHLTEPEKEFKRSYANGRREWEHEFSKVMRHRSIRHLADGDTGLVLRDLKPIWLMSPLSVSDTLPLADQTFDVVIFDEASQVLVEEAMPAASRARQVIVVGDEMQLPPTNFFSAARSDGKSLLDGDDGVELATDLDADSFLTQAARNLPSVMLGWHYRSRSESLISFSNHAFYEGTLLTIPDREPPSGLKPELVCEALNCISRHVDALLARSLSFHFQPNGLYDERRNTPEAVYISHLVRELLARQTGLSLGIVAFSEAQQGEIEEALDRLASEDDGFRDRLAAEYEREENGQVCGLFVKNLENVQGDERDVVILSVCYGPDRTRRTLMNFGPINQRGGEKRLNVIFSRARRHMAVISSMRPADITNDFNDGAKCLKNFLEYAAASSVGDAVTARRVLHGSYSRFSPEPDSGPVSPAGDQIAERLRAMGFFVDQAVGQSAFRVPLAVRQSEAEAQTLAILLDDSAHYEQSNLLERYLLRPAILESFGWKVTLVFTKDWLQDPEAVIKQIQHAIEGGGEVAAEHPAMAAAPAAAKPGPPLEPPAPPAAPAKKAPEPKPVVRRRLISNEDGSDKFWEGSVQGAELSIRFGRRDTKGQIQTKRFETDEEALRELERLARSKLGKGYLEQS